MPIGDDSLSNYAFMVEFDGELFAHFQEVSGLGIQIQVMELKQNTKGGLPVNKKLPGAINFPPLKLRRGKTDDAGWWKWIKQVQDGKIDEARKNGSIALYDYERGEKVRWNIHLGWPSEVSLGALHAGGNEIAIEELTVVHEGLELA